MGSAEEVVDELVMVGEEDGELVVLLVVELLGMGELVVDSRVEELLELGGGAELEEGSELELLEEDEVTGAMKMEEEDSEEEMKEDENVVGGKEDEEGGANDEDVVGSNEDVGSEEDVG